MVNHILSSNGKCQLSVLIATMPSRDKKLFSLIENLINQKLVKDLFGCYAMPSFEVITDDSMEYNIGIKRQKLLELAIGDYVVFIDDDDRISPNYIQEILKAASYNPDCIGIEGEITFDGHNKRKWYISKEYRYWHDNGGCYYRTPNHISPVKRSLALKTGFKPISFAEDKDYSDRLLPLLKTEVVIQGCLYYYDYVRNK